MPWIVHSFSGINDLFTYVYEIIERFKGKRYKKWNLAVDFCICARKGKFKTVKQRLYLKTCGTWKWSRKKRSDRGNKRSHLTASSGKAVYETTWQSGKC
jgi:hypothetical protein